MAPKQLNSLQKRRRADPAYRLREQIHTNLYAARRRQRLGQLDHGRPISKHAFSRTALAAHFTALGQDICDPTLELDHIKPLSGFALDELGPSLERVAEMCREHEDAHWFLSRVGPGFNFVIAEYGFAAYRVDPSSYVVLDNPKYFEEPGGPFSGAKNLRTIPVAKLVEIAFIYVIPEWRRKGVGRSLIIG